MKRAVIILLFLLAGYQYGHCSRLVLGYQNIIAKTDIKGLIETDSLGTLISTIEFKLKATKGDLDTFEDGIIPWVSIDKPGEEIDSLVGADEIVLPFSTAILVIDYPLKNEARFILSGGKRGFSRRQLIKIISEKYHHIYEKEEQTVTENTTPHDSKGVSLNRNETDGVYGIWGHDISDLVLSSIEVYKDTSGEIYLVLNIES
jgi:hypothetical protein